MWCRHELRVTPSISDDDVRALAVLLALGDFRATVRRGLRGRVFLFEHGLIERRQRRLTVSFDDTSEAAVEELLAGLEAELRDASRLPGIVR